MEDSNGKKKRKPTLTFYQPPGSRGARNSSEIKKVTAELNAISLDVEQNHQKSQNISKNPAKKDSAGKSFQVEEERPESSKKSYRNNRQNNQQLSPKLESNSSESSNHVNKKIEAAVEIQKQQSNPFESDDCENKKVETAVEVQKQQNKPPETAKPKQNETIPQPPIKEVHRGGILKVNLGEIADSHHASHDNQHQRVQTETTDNTQYKSLFDPYNPTKPILIQQSQRQQKTKASRSDAASDSHQQVYQLQTVQHQQLVNANAINEAKANTLIQMMQQLDSQLKVLIEKCDYSRYKDFHERINDMRKQLERLCMQSFLTHIEASTKFNVDLNYWKLCYHQLIENLRKEYNYAMSTLNDTSYSSQIRSYLDFYIIEGFQFYELFIKELERTYNFDKNLYLLDSNQLKPSKGVKLAILCVNRCLICLGDLARYRESFNEIKDYGLARSYYLKAMHLAPKCSRAYNQLAILALYTRRRLDAVYYYIRCLELNQPLHTARQSLISLFDEARKRSEIITENLNKKKLRNKAANVSVYSNSDSNRVELWMKTSTVAADNTVAKTQPKVKSEIDEDDEEDDGEDGCCIDDDNDNNELLNLSSVELNKRFMHDYLNLIGKLFTKVGMESYTEVCSRMLFEFRELLKREPCPIGKMRLLQLTVINISIINLTKTANQQREPYQNFRRRGLAANLSEDESEQQSVVDESTVVQRNQLQEFGVQLSLDMFTMIVKRLTRLLSNYGNSETAGTKMRETFPSVKLFTDWMKRNLNLWYPLPDQLPPDLGPNPDLFQIISKFLNQISQIDSTAVSFQNSQNEDTSLVSVVLDEDREISGFLPLDTANKEVNFAESTSDYDLEAFKDYMRFNKMVAFGDFLLNLKKPVIKYDIMNRVYMPYSLKIVSQEKEKKVENNDENNEDENSLSNDSELNEALAALGDDNEISELIEKRKHLKAKVDEKLNREKQLQTIVDTTSSRRIELEIRPRFLVPDTNCFIDHLNLVDTMLKSNRYIVVVPLLVINELEKLAKSISNYNDDSIEHAEMVQRNAKKAMEFLHEKFESRDRNLKALTSLGSTLETIQFRSEELKAQGNNDDLILGCCLHYCRDNARDFMPNDRNAAIHLFREVVLLTEDRNLRLKAHTRNVPVKNIMNFCKWANLTVTSQQPNAMTKRKSNKN